MPKLTAAIRPPAMLKRTSVRSDLAPEPNCPMRRQIVGPLRDMGTNRLAWCHFTVS